MENKCNTENQKRGRGRPRNDHEVHSLRCSDAEFEELKEYLRKLRTKRKSEIEKIKKLEKQGQQKLKF